MMKYVFLRYVQNGLVVIALATILLSVHTNIAHATAPTPSWWVNPVCDAGHFSGLNSYKLGGSLNGVDACGPTNNYYGVNFFPGAVEEGEWQCTELSTRYMYLVYGINPYVANGKDVVNNYPGPSSVLVKTTNDGQHGLPTPGDILSMGAVGDNIWGHTSIVTTVNTVGGITTVATIEQNGPNANGIGNPITVTNNALGSNVSGWLHNPNNDSLQMIKDNIGQVWAHTGISSSWNLETPSGETAISAGGSGLQMIKDSIGQVWAHNDMSTAWTQETPSGETAISAGGNGLQMVMDGAGQVWAHSSISNSWTQETPPGITAISAGGDGLQMIKDSIGQVWAHNSISNSWTLETPPGITAISAGGNGLQMIMDSVGQVWAHNSISNSWTLETPPWEAAISAGGNGLQMIMDGAGQVWAHNTISSSWTLETPSGETAISAGGNGLQMIMDSVGQVWAHNSISTAWSQETYSSETAISAGD